jgi:hypothetical protein
MRKRPFVLLFLVILILQVTGVLALYLSEPSEPGSTVLLGFSTPKLALIALLLTADLLLVGTLASLVVRSKKVTGAFLWLGRFLADADLRKFVSFLLGLVGVVVASYLVTGRLLEAELYEGDPYLAVVDQLWKLMGLALAICLELIIFLGWFFRKYSIQTTYRSKYRFTTLVKLFFSRAAIVVLVPGILTVFALLLTRISFREVIPDWFFRNKNHVAPFRLWHVAVLLGGVLPLVYLIIRQQANRLWRILALAGILMVVLPVFAQEPDSRLYYNVSHLRDYTQGACAAGTPVEFITDYEEISTGNLRLATKPPGYVVPFIWLRDLLRTVHSDDLAIRSECLKAQWQALTVVAVLFPLLTLAVLYQVSGFFLPQEEQYLPVLVAAFFPNFLTMAGAIDHYYLPLVFAVVMWLAVAAVARRSYLLGFLAGAGIYLAVFASFALLPIAVVAFGWLSLDYLFHRQVRSLPQTVLLGAPMVLGVLVIGVVFYLAFDYDPVARWQAALVHHRQTMLIKSDWLSLLKNMSLSVVEYGIFLGLPTWLLLAVGLYTRWTKPDPNPAPGRKAFSILAAGLFGALLLSSSNNVEVARIWLFLNPLPALVTAFWLREFAPELRTRLLLGYLALQLSLAYLYTSAFFGRLA